MRAMYRIYGVDGHRFRGSWQASRTFKLNNGLTVETWCHDRNGTHQYADIEVRFDGVCSPELLYNEMRHQLDDGVFECCNYGDIKKLNYSFYWTTGCPTSKEFNSSVANFENLLNCYSVDSAVLFDVEEEKYTFFKPEFSGSRFTTRKEI